MGIIKIVAIIVLGLMMATIFPCVGASINKINEKENITKYESRIYGIGFVRIYENTHVIKGFIIFAINNGQIILTQFIRIKFSEADGVFAGIFPPYKFYIRYNPK